MVYGQEELFETEEELNEFMQHLTWAWVEGWSANKIARELKFGEPEPEGYPKLKPQHVYYFITKYGHEWEDVEPRRKLKKKEEETEVKQRIPYSADMSFEVANYLRGKGWLLE